MSVNLSHGAAFARAQMGEMEEIVYLHTANRLLEDDKDRKVFGFIPMHVSRNVKRKFPRRNKWQEQLAMPRFYQVDISSHLFQNYKTKSQGFTKQVTVSAKSKTQNSYHEYDR
ncbi:unnamed protein product [Dovyalis caffra]|uniref:Uncharacterized protein n=1 Tax=Dovyalis caffra TaxID=77055 RepID=A0AAV1RDC6_9ROSI|nr:unnamed protein product [Dovyalis caffra]